MNSRTKYQVILTSLEKKLNLTIFGQTITLKIQGFDHKWQDWSNQGQSGRTSSTGPGIV